jgi:hypothetical protein
MTATTLSQRLCRNNPSNCPDAVSYVSRSVLFQWRSAKSVG